MPKDSYGFAIVGCGLISQFHGNAIKAADGAELVCAADLNRERLDKFCTDFSCEPAESFEAILADDRVDVVNVCTPNAYHAMFAVPAMNAGKHVVVEKPPEMTLDKCDQMIEARDRNGVKLAISLQVRFRKPIEAIKQAIEQGRFGRLLQADTYMKWFRSTDYYLQDDWRSKREEGAGVTIQHAFHYIDLLHHLMGPVTQVDARMTNLAHPEVALEDTLNAFLEYANGALGVVQASTALWPGTDIRVEINGEDGTVIMAGERIVTWEFRDKRPGDEEMVQIGDASVKTAAGGAADFAYTEHLYMIQDMLQAIETDRSPRISCESARGTLAIALAMYQSADEGAPVRLG
jgi:predicted dehydrogenase